MITETPKMGIYQSLQVHPGLTVFLRLSFSFVGDSVGSLTLKSLDLADVWSVAPSLRAMAEAL